MRTRHGRSNGVVGAALLLSMFAVPHLIDDFLFGIPDEFGISNRMAQSLSGIFIFILIYCIIMAARERKSGYFACAGLGLFLALAGILKHIPRMLQPGPYWSGWFSEVLIYGLIVSGLLLTSISIWAVGHQVD